MDREAVGRSAEPPSRTPAGGNAGAAARDVPGGLTPAAVLALQRTAGNAAVAAMLQRQAVQTASGAFVGDKAGPTNNIREEVIQVMHRLHMLWSMSNPDFSAEYPNVSAKAAGTAIAPADIPKTIAALKQNEDPSVAGPVAQQFLRAGAAGPVGKGQANVPTDVLAVQDGLKNTGELAGPDYFVESKEGPNALLSGTFNVDERKIPKTLAAIASFKRKAVAGTFRVDLFAGTKAVTPGQHTDVAKILAGPAATVVPAVGVGVPAKVTVPKMKGAGVGGKFEKAMVKALDKYIKQQSDEFKKLKAKGPAFPVASANDIAAAAQTEVERYFGPYIAGASRKPGDRYHPGSYSLVAKLGDQSTRPLDDSFSASGRRGWLQYWMTTKGYGGKEVMDKFDCHPSERPAPDEDGKEFLRVLDLVLVKNKAEIDDAIHGWPAEAGTGTVFIQPYGDTDPKALRAKRWELFTTLIHEMMHILEHPNFGTTANAIGNPASTILTEGFAEVMRKDLWVGPGQLEKRIASVDLAGLREQVEGSKLPYDAKSVVDASYYDEYNDAKAIVDKVGMPNAKAAFFLGHTDLLGLGQGTPSGTPLTDVAMWSDKDSDTADQYTVKAGETDADVRKKTRAAKLLDLGGASIKPGTGLAAGTVVRAPGIKWVWAIDGDTVASVAKQHDIREKDLAIANGMAPAVAPTTTIPAGRKVLIPAHAAVSP